MGGGTLPPPPAPLKILAMPGCINQCRYQHQHRTMSRQHLEEFSSWQFPAAWWTADNTQTSHCSSDAHSSNNKYTKSAWFTASPAVWLTYPKATSQQSIDHLLVEIQKNSIPFARTQLYQKFFFPDATRLRNSMPPNIVNSTSLETFKQEVQKIRLR